MRNRQWFANLAEDDTPWSYFGTRRDVYHRHRVSELVHGIDLYLTRPSFVLEVGAGSGEIGHGLAGAGHKVVGLDHFVCDGVRPGSGVQADCRSLPFGSATLDGALLCEIVYYFEPDDVAILLRECQRVVKPGSPILISQRRAFRQAELTPEQMGIPAELVAADWWTLGRLERFLKLPVYIVGTSTRVSEAIERSPAPLRAGVTRMLDLYCSALVDEQIKRLGNLARRVLPAAWLRSTRNLILVTTE